MIARRECVRWVAVLLVVLLLAGLVGCTGRDAHERRASEVNKFSRRFEAALEKQGFEVNEGYVQLWGVEDCPNSLPVLGGCDFNNPTAPYLFPAVPYWPDEFVDPGLVGAFGETRPGYGTTFRLDPNEAIVLLGYLPPEAAYLGIQSYLFTRKGDYQTDNETYEYHVSFGSKDLFFHKMPLSPERIGCWDSLSDSTNNVVIERQSGSVWEQFRYLIVTADQQTETQVRQVLGKLSVAEKDIFTQPIPSNVRIGLDKDADDFLTLIRYSMPADGGGPGTASDTWRHDPSLAVLRIRFKGGTGLPSATRPGTKTAQNPEPEYPKPISSPISPALCTRWPRRGGSLAKPTIVRAAP